MEKSLSLLHEEVFDILVDEIYRGNHLVEDGKERRGVDEQTVLLVFESIAIHLKAPATSAKLLSERDQLFHDARMKPLLERFAAPVRHHDGGIEGLFIGFRELIDEQSADLLAYDGGIGAQPFVERFSVIDLDRGAGRAALY